MLRDPQSLECRHCALLPASRLQGAGDDKLGLCSCAGLRRRRRAARGDARAPARDRGCSGRAGQCRFRGRLCGCTRSGRRERAAVHRDRSGGALDRGLDRRSKPAALRFRPRARARARHTRGDRQGRGRRRLHGPHRGLRARSPRPRGNRAPAEGLCRGRRRLSLFAGHQDPRGDRGHGEGSCSQAGEPPDFAGVVGNAELNAFFSSDAKRR